MEEHDKSLEKKIEQANSLEEVLPLKKEMRDYSSTPRWPCSSSNDLSGDVATGFFDDWADSDEIQKRVDAIKTLAACGIDESALNSMRWASDSEADEATSNLANFLISKEALNISKLNHDLVYKHKIDPELPKNFASSPMKKTISELKCAQDSGSSSGFIKELTTSPAFKEIKKELGFASSINKRVAEDLELEVLKRIRKKDYFMVRTKTEYELLMAIKMKIEGFIIPAIPRYKDVLQHAISDGYTVLLHR